MAGPIITPAVEAALAKAGPKVAAALGMDVAAGISDVAAVGEAGLNPIADGAGAIATPIAAVKDAEALAGTRDVLVALAESPAGKAALQQGGKTVEQIGEEVAKRGPAALKEALDTPAGRGVLDEMKAVWDRIPVKAQTATIGAAGYVGMKIVDGALDPLKNLAKNAIDHLIGEPKPSAITISQNDGREQPIAKGGLTGRVVGYGENEIELKVGRDTFTVHNLPADLVKDMVSRGGDLQHISVDMKGQAVVADLTQNAPQPQHQVGHGAR